jgi:hydrogenase expression/formation protein HypE
MNLTCPLPAVSSEIITLAHGSGGSLTGRLLQEVIFSQLNNQWLQQQHDGACFELNGPVAFSTDSYVVSPLFFPGGNIGDLAVNGTVNDLAMCGAKARYLSLSFIIEEGLSIADFTRVVQHIRQAAEAAEVAIVTGDTKVVQKGKGDQLFINTSGIGILHPSAQIHHGRILPGDVLLISGSIAAHGMAIMSKREGLSFACAIESDTAPLHSAVMRLLDRFGTDIHFLRDATRGGVAAILHEVIALTGLGVELDEAAIAVETQVAAACELLGLDPLFVANEGVFVTVVRAEIAADVLQELQGDTAGKQAAIAGFFTSEHPGKLLMKNISGGRRVIPYLAGEQLPRIC